MQISWFTVIAQVLNFFLLVWLLKRFLYKPVLNAIQAREDKISSQLSEAELKKAEAKMEQDEYRKRNESFERRRGEMMEVAKVEVNTERERLMEVARGDAGALRARLEKSFNELQAKWAHEISERMHREVFAISRKTLHDLASAPLEAQLVAAFVNRVKELSDEEKQQFNDAFASDPKRVLVRSAFDLSQQQQNEVKDAVSELMKKKPEFEFTLAPELISGIVLTSNGYRVSWSIESYINSLEGSVGGSNGQEPEKRKT